MTLPVGDIGMVSNENFVLNRTSFPDSLGSGELIAPEAFGSEFWWGWGVAGCFQALASPRSGAPVPSLPREGDPHPQSLGYWGALHFLLLYRLGWSAPHRGLQRWYELGKPTDDPTLRFVAQVWGRDSGLDIYLEWLLRRRPIFNLATGQPWAHVDPAQPLAEWNLWLRNFHGSSESSRFEWFSHAGGGDPLHLTAHFEQVETSPHDSILLVDPRQSDRAHLITSSVTGFYRELHSHSAALPMVGLHSWKVDVHVSNVGVLGTFRRSAETGLWFTGRHKVHAMGNDR